MYKKLRTIYTHTVYCLHRLDYSAVFINRNLVPQEILAQKIKVANNCSVQFRNIQKNRLKLLSFSIGSCQMIIYSLRHFETLTLAVSTVLNHDP